MQVARTNAIVSTLVALLAAAAPFVTLAMAGVTVDSQAAVLRQIDAVGARTITVVSSAGEPVIPAAAVGRVGDLAGVAWVIGLGPAVDGRLDAPAGAPTPVRGYVGVRAPVTFDSGGRFVSPDGTGAVKGTAYVSSVSAKRLGVAGAYGAVIPAGLRIVGSFRAADPLVTLGRFVLEPIVDGSALLERMIVAVDDVGMVDRVSSALPGMLGMAAARATTIELNPSLIAARAAVGDELARRDRSLVLLVLGATVVLCSVVVFAGGIAARRDFGRRRALGATRAQLAVLVVESTLWPALLGGFGGALLGWLSVNARLGRAGDWRFAAAVGILTILATAGASLLPAIHAATRDPLRVLRVP